MDFHMYADDTQLYKSVPANQIDGLLSDASTCILAVKDWMLANKLKLNDDKTEIILCCPPHKRQAIVQFSSIVIGAHSLPISQDAKTLGVYLDSTISMKKQLNCMCQSLFLELRRISQLMPYLTLPAAKKLVSASFMSRLDYCNATLYGLPKYQINRLQRLQNCAARIILKQKKGCHVTPLLFELHWLPVHLRINYKLATMCYRYFENTVPSYISDLLLPYEPSRDLRSKDKMLLCVPKARLKTVGNRAFTYAGPTVWNALDLNLRKSVSLEQFKEKLKTDYFSKYFCDCFAV